MKQNIKNIPIRELLVRMGITARKEYHGYGMYLSPLREEATPSFKVDYRDNLWYDHGTGEGGDLIALAQKL